MTSHRQALTGAALSILGLTICLAAPAVAQGPDTLGLWFDTAYTANDGEGSAFPFFGTAYLVLHEPSLDGVGGWECKVTAAGPVTLLTWALEGQAVNFASPPEFIVGLGSPLPSGQDVLLATVQFLIDAPAPVTFSLGPVYHASIPGAMAYIPFADPNDLRPLTTGTGTPEVAWYNRELPVCTLSAGAVDFGVRPLGSQTFGYLTIGNDGGGTLWVDPQITGADSDFAIVAGGGAGGLEPGQQRNLTLRFTPTFPGGQWAQLAISGDCPAVTLTGSGREPVVSGYVAHNPVDFGEIAVTTTAQRAVSVFNTGEVPLEIAVQPVGGCPAFGFGGTTTFTLAPGANAPVILTFTPPTVGSYACEVALHPVIPPLLLAGSARAAVDSWAVAPGALDFGGVGLAGGPVLRSVTVRNTGERAADLDLALDDPSGSYTIVSPADPQPRLQPGLSVVVTVGFDPATLGTHPATLVLGSGPPDVPLTGTGQEPAPGCQATALLVDFGDVAQGGQTARSLRVNNIGNTVLHFEPAVSCPEFSVTSYPQTIAPGGFGWFNLAYRPADLGVDQCGLDLGPDACAQVALRGAGISGGWGDGTNLVAVSFDPDVILPETTTPAAAVVTAYLMLVNPATHEGVWAWELRLGLDPQVLLLQSNLGPMSLNFANPPEYIVGLGAPIPDAPIIVLAEFVLLPLDTDPHPISVGPVHIPSIPGQMAWGYNADVQLATMFPITGEPVVAWINPDIDVAVLAPEPTATVAGGRVELRWPVPSDGTGGCHVYRALGGLESRLNGAPLQPGAGGYLYTDDTAGLPAGATVAYSYAVLRGGVEIARSPAVAIELPGAGALADRLLPNRPNPFNPETEIRFEMAGDGRLRLEVFDVSGRRVAMLEDGVRRAGAHQVVWCGRDDAGRTVPSGAYYVRLETDRGRDTRKVMLLK